MEFEDDANFEDELSRIENEKHREYIQLTKGKMEELMAVLNSEKFKHADSKHGVEIYSFKDEDAGVYWVKGEGIVDFPIDEWIDYIGDYANRGKMDDMFVEGGVVEDIGMNTRIEKFTVNPSALVSNRDFCIVTRRVHTNQGRVIWMACSWEHDDVPPIKGVVRAVLIIGGWILDPVPGDHNKTFAHYIVEGDPKGSIPKMIVNLGYKKQGLLPYKLNKAMHKDLD